MSDFALLYTPRAQKDLKKLPFKEANQVLDDLAKLQGIQKGWPWSQTKRLRGHPYWELKTGDFRSIVLLQKQKLVILRVVNRRDLEREIKRIDWRWLVEWLKRI